MESLWPKKFSHVFESKRLDIDSQFKNWLLISSQFDSNRSLVGMLGRILVPPVPVTRLFRSKWLHFFYQCEEKCQWKKNSWKSVSCFFFVQEKNSCRNRVLNSRAIWRLKTHMLQAIENSNWMQNILKTHCYENI